VARLRRAARERSVGHAGTLDPRATGLLVLVLGCATRLASFLTSHDKSYDAVIRLGISTDTHDAEGRTVSAEAPPQIPSGRAIAAALDGFRGTFLQVPPAHSAKKIQGQKAYDLARRDQPVILEPVSVTVRQLEIVAQEGSRVDLRMTVTAGFYVRALARDLGERLGCGAHLEALRRTASGTFGLGQALTMDEAERLGPDLADRLLSPAEALAELPGVELTDTGLRRAAHGNWLSQEHLVPGNWPSLLEPSHPRFRLLGPGGRLIAVAEPRRGTLHPVVVLG
jgi:tRNA pseudouridine55 synthase